MRRADGAGMKQSTYCDNFTFKKMVEVSNHRFVRAPVSQMAIDNGRQHLCRGRRKVAQLVSPP